MRDRSALILDPRLRGDDEKKQVGIWVCALARALQYLTNRSDWLVRMQFRALETVRVKPPLHANGAQLTPAVRERWRIHALVVYCHPVETSFHAALHTRQPFLPQQHRIEAFCEPRLKRFLGRVGQAMARLA